MKKKLVMLALVGLIVGFLVAFTTTLAVAKDMPGVKTDFDSSVTLGVSKAKAVSVRVVFPQYTSTAFDKYSRVKATMTVYSNDCHSWSVENQWSAQDFDYGEHHTYTVYLSPSKLHTCDKDAYVILTLRGIDVVTNVSQSWIQHISLKKATRMVSYHQSINSKSTVHLSGVLQRASWSHHKYVRIDAGHHVYPYYRFDSNHEWDRRKGRVTHSDGSWSASLKNYPYGQWMVSYLGSKEYGNSYTSVKLVAGV